MVLKVNTMADRIITVGTDYTTAPGGRFKDHGEFSGQDFRDRILAPALRENEHLTVYLDGTAGYAGSFLEEAFGGLIRVCKFSYRDLTDRLQVRAKDNRYAIYVRMVQQYLRDAANQSNSARVA